MQLYTDAASDWRLVCKESFDLTPLQLATLCAIVAYANTNDGAAMPLEELRRVEAKAESVGIYELNCTFVMGELYRLGLVQRIGPPHDRSFAPTARGVRRLAG